MEYCGINEVYIRIEVYVFYPLVRGYIPWLTLAEILHRCTFMYDGQRLKVKGQMVEYSLVPQPK